MNRFMPFFIVAAFCLVCAQSVDQQPPKTWVKRYTKASLGDVVHPYENGFVWDRHNGVGMVFQGHLGTYTGLNGVWPEFGEVYNTNQTWLYSHESAAFTVTHPFDRPQKTCGAKMYYDENMRRVVIYGGGFHGSDNGYWEVHPTGNKLVKEDKQSDGIGNPRVPWVFDCGTRQWYEMRSLLEGPSMVNHWWGYEPNWAYIKEYGVGMLVPSYSSGVYIYCAHANAWALITAANPAMAVPTAGSMLPVAYDRKYGKVVTVYGAATYLFHFGTRTWERVTPSPAPDPGYHGSSDQWYEGYACMTYDINAGKCVFIRDDGAQTWSFDAQAKTWTQETVTGRPPNAGSMGEGLAYDANNHVCVLFSNKNDEIWTYRQEAANTDRLDEAVNVDAVTTESEVAVSWGPPVQGPAPDKYYVYRAAWTDHLTAGRSIEPGPYALIDSTTDTFYTDTPAKAAKTFYTYSIQPVLGAQTGLMSDPAFSRRPAPLGLIATVFDRNRVGLKWVADTGSDVTGYNVYRKYGAIPQYTELVKISSAPVGPRPVFLDSSVNLTGDTIATYVVTTLNRLGQESGLSPRADTRIKRVMGIWCDSTQGDSFFLSWSPTTADTQQCYEVWYQPVGKWETGVAPAARAFTNVTDTFRLVSKALHWKVRVKNALGQDGHFSDLVPVASAWTENTGMYRGDGMFTKPGYDPFWDRLGLAPSEVGVETPPGGPYAQPGALFLRAVPNPFNPAVKIAVSGQRITDNDIEIAIYNVSGEIVYRLSATSYQLTAGFTWNASAHPSGLYLVRLRAGNRTVEKKITLIK